MANYYLGHTGEELDEAIRRVLSGELNVPLQEKRVTPTTSEQIVAPDSDYKGLSRVTVEGIPQSYTDEVYNQGYEAGYNAEKPYMAELEYIESTGTQYIDTGVKSKSALRIKIKAQQMETTTASRWLFGGRNAYADSSIVFFWNGSQSSWQGDYQKSTLRYSFDNTIAKVQGVIEVDANKNVWNVNGIEHDYGEVVFESNYNLALFATNDWGTITGHSKVKVWYCQIYDNGTLVRDYIPCKNNGEFGLYDLVEGKFYGNAGTGVFAGEIVVVENTGVEEVVVVTRTVNTLYVGRNCTIKTKNGIRTSIITAMERSSDSSMISLIFGNLKVTLIEKLKGVEAKT